MADKEKNSQSSNDSKLSALNMKTKFKYCLTILLLCSVFIISCKENNPVESNFKKYQGTWLWMKTVGGLFPRVITPKNGNAIKIVYDGYGIFGLYRNDSLKVSAIYNVGKIEYGYEKISYSNIMTYNYYFTSMQEYAKVRTDTLEIWDGLTDGFFSFYKKKIKTYNYPLMITS